MPDIDYCHHYTSYVTTQEECGPFRPVDNNHKLGIWPAAECLNRPADWEHIKALGYSSILTDIHHLSDANQGGWKNSEILLSVGDLLWEYCDMLDHPTDTAKKGIFEYDFNSIKDAIALEDFYGAQFDEPTTRFRDCWNAHGKEFISIFHGNSSIYPLHRQNVLVDAFTDFDVLAPIVDGIIADDWLWNNDLNMPNIPQAWISAWKSKWQLIPGSFFPQYKPYPVKIGGWLNIANKYSIDPHSGQIVEDQYDHFVDILKSAKTFFDNAAVYGNGPATVWIYQGDICQELLVKILAHLDGIPHQDNLSWYLGELPNPANPKITYWRLGFYDIIAPIINNAKVKADLSDLEPPLQDFLRHATTADLLNFFLACWHGQPDPQYPCGDSGQCLNGGKAQDLMCWLSCNRMMDAAAKAVSAGWLRQDCMEYDIVHNERYSCRRSPCNKVTCPWNDDDDFNANMKIWKLEEKSSLKGSARPKNKLPNPIYYPPVVPCKYPLGVGTPVNTSDYPVQVFQSQSRIAPLPKTIAGTGMNVFMKKGFIFDQ